jgi:hypothetical protein
MMNVRSGQVTTTRVVGEDPLWVGEPLKEEEESYVRG